MRCRNDQCASNSATHICSRCRLYTYCSNSCQRADWPRHKLACGKPSGTVLEGYVLSEIEHQELSATPPSLKNESLSEWQLLIRAKTAQGLHSAAEKGFPEEVQRMYQMFPTHTFYKDQKERPVRLFGVMSYRSEDPYMHSITLRKTGESVFTIGGTPGKSLSRLTRWDDASLAIINKSKTPGLFLDPLGNELAVGLAEDTGYSFLSDHMCPCCCRHGGRLPTSRPVLLSPEHLEHMTETCDACGKVGKGHACGACRKVRYCDVDCQKKAWPRHRLSCARG